MGSLPKYTNSSARKNFTIKHGSVICFIRIIEPCFYCDHLRSRVVKYNRYISPKSALILTSNIKASTIQNNFFNLNIKLITTTYEIIMMQA